MVDHPGPAHGIRSAEQNWDPMVRIRSISGASLNNASQSFINKVAMDRWSTGFPVIFSVCHLEYASRFRTPRIHAECQNVQICWNKHQRFSPGPDHTAKSRGSSSLVGGTLLFLFT